MGFSKTFEPQEEHCCYSNVISSNGVHTLAKLAQIFLLHGPTFKEDGIILKKYFENKIVINFFNSIILFKLTLFKFKLKF